MPDGNTQGILRPRTAAQALQLLRCGSRSAKNKDETGSITAFYTVLVDGDDMNEPIADTVRGILDGHFVLDRKLANKGQFPAINVLKSISRVMSHIIELDHSRAAETVRQYLSSYLDAEDLINIGAYKKGSNLLIDEAISNGNSESYSTRTFTK